MTLLAPRIGNEVSYVTQIIDDIHFAWQAQYLVRLAGDFSWQAQHIVTFWKIAGDAKCCILQYKIVSKMGRVRSPKRRVRDDDYYRRIIVGYRRIILESSFYWRKHFREFPTEILSFKISWQAQYLVRLEGDLTCSTHWK